MDLPEKPQNSTVTVLDEKNFVRLNSEIRNNPEVFQTLIDFINDGILLLDPVSGCILNCNASAHNHLGYTRDEFLRLHISIIDPGLAEAKTLEDYVTGLKVGVNPVVRIPMVRKNRETFFAEVSSNFVSLNKRDFIIATFRDVTERETLLQQLEELTLKDQLTGIANRRAFDLFFDDCLKRNKRHQHPLNAVIADIDHFKSVNDTFGHAAGDEVLIAFSRLVEANIREVDGFFRWGGEEFVILLPDAPFEQAMNVAERIRKACESFSFSIDRTVTVSLGVATFLQTETVDQFISRADKALYQSKTSGRNRVTAA